MPIMNELGAVDADPDADVKSLDEIAVRLIEKHGVGLNDLGDVTPLGRDGKSWP
jgi:hypothetical protein